VTNLPLWFGIPPSYTPRCFGFGVLGSFVRNWVWA